MAERAAAQKFECAMIKAASKARRFRFLRGNRIGDRKAGTCSAKFPWSYPGHSETPQS